MQAGGSVSLFICYFLLLSAATLTIDQVSNVRFAATIDLYTNVMGHTI